MSVHCYVCWNDNRPSHKLSSVIYEKPKTDLSFGQLDQLLENKSLALDLC
ncbi:MAG: hypothetical protein ACPIA2_07055 [Mariniblastus sp.]